MQNFVIFEAIKLGRFYFQESVYQLFVLYLLHSAK